MPKKFKIKIISKGRLEKKKTTIKKVPAIKKLRKQPAKHQEPQDQPMREIRIVVHRLTAGEIAEHEVYPAVPGQGRELKAFVEKEKKVLQQRN